MSVSLNLGIIERMSCRKLFCLLNSFWGKDDKWVEEFEEKSDFVSVFEDFHINFYFKLLKSEWEIEDRLLHLSLCFLIERIRNFENDIIVYVIEEFKLEKWKRKILSFDLFRVRILEFFVRFKIYLFFGKYWTQ